MIFTVEFWRAAGERAVKAFSYSLLGMLGGGVSNIVEMPWLSAAKVAAGIAVLSILGSIGSSVATGGGPSLTNAEVLDGNGVPEAEK